MISLFSILDNFGIDGGRNGFFYIQSVTAQDLPVAVMFYLVSLMLVQALSKNSFSKIEYHLFLIFIVFLIQIKLSVVFVGILLIIHVINLIKKKLENKFISQKDIYITRKRHRNNLEKCLEYLTSFEEKNSIEDFDKAAEDLRLATRHLGMIVGKVDIEEILGSIFNNFCIGK